jgi:hypothetical protein
MESKWRNKALGFTLVFGAIFAFLAVCGLYYVAMSFALRGFGHGVAAAPTWHGLVTVLTGTTCIIAVLVGMVYITFRATDGRGFDDEDQDGGGHGNIRRWPYKPPPGGGGLTREPSGKLAVETRYVGDRPVTITLAPQPAPKKVPDYM